MLQVAILALHAPGSWKDISYQVTAAESGPDLLKSLLRNEDRLPSLAGLLPGLAGVGRRGTESVGNIGYGSDLVGVSGGVWTPLSTTTFSRRRRRCSFSTPFAFSPLADRSAPWRVIRSSSISIRCSRVTGSRRCVGERRPVSSTNDLNEPVRLSIGVCWGGLFTKSGD